MTVGFDELLEAMNRATTAALTADSEPSGSYDAWLEGRGIDPAEFHQFVQKLDVIPDEWDGHRSLRTGLKAGFITGWTAAIMYEDFDS